MTEHSPTPPSDGINPWRFPWRHLRLNTESPDIEICPGSHARIAMTRRAMIAKVEMTAGSAQPQRSHRGDTMIVVTAGELRMTVEDRTTTLVVDEAAMIPANQPYSLTAGAEGCTRMDVLVPPDMALAEEAFHQEHVHHGFE